MTEGRLAGSDVDALRRRLYRPGASDEDRRRFEAAAATVPTAPEVAAVPVRPRPDRARPGRALAVALAGAALLIGVVALLAPHAVVRPEADRFGSGAAREVSPRAALDASTGAARGQEFRGRGSADVAVDRSGLSFDAGALRVELTTTRTAPIRWTATRIDARQDWSSVTRVLARTSGVLRAGAPDGQTLAWRGAPPAIVHVEAPSSVGWDLVLTRVDDAAQSTRCQAGWCSLAKR